MAEHNDWQEADLLQLVAEQADESLELDFKESGALQKTDGKKRELSKDVSAFANSAGGTLIYGIIEDQETHVASKLDDGCDPKEITKEWVEQVINSNIQPRLSGVRIYSIELTTQNPGKFAYVVDVPQGSTAHQASDKRYYKRFNFESVPMEDYEIRDVMQRVTAPKIAVEAEVDGKMEGECKFLLTGQEGQFQTAPPIRFLALNEPEAGVCLYSQYQIFVPEILDSVVEMPLADKALEGVRRVASRASATVLRDNSGSLRFKYHEIDLTPTDMPIFPGERRDLCTMTFGIPIDLSRTWSLLLWRSRPAMSETKTGAIFFQHQASLDWYFQAMTIADLEEKNNWTIELAP